MDPKLLLLRPQSASPAGPSPLFLSFPSSSLSYPQKPTFPSRTHLSLARSPSRTYLSLARSPFLGNNLILHETHLEFGKPNKTHLPVGPVVAAGVVKRRKEPPLDSVIQRDKKLKLVLKIRNILVSQPDRIMNLRDLGRFRRDLGLTRKRRFIALLKRFPAVFDIVEEGVYSLKFRLTPEAERIYLEELRVRNGMEDAVVVKLRKLLMMSLDKRILLEKIAHLKADLGLPSEFRATICDRYPHYFRVVHTDRGPALELTHWDSALAVSAAEAAEEENRIREMEERNLIIDRPPKFKRVNLPRGLNLSKGEMSRVFRFRDMPYISPYSDFSGLRAGTPEKEKHACGVVHEMLSLTLEKRTLVDHLTHFREEFRFSQQLRGMLIRHPDMFYVSLKGDRDSVFLREAYRDSQLLEKNKLLLLKEKMRALVAIPRFRNRDAMKTGVAGEGDRASEEGSGGEEDGEEWSDVDGFLPNGSDSEFDDEEDGEHDGEDDWSDDEDEMPPDFDDGESLIFEGSRSPTHNAPKTNEGKVLVPMYPDGSPRERW